MLPFRGRKPNTGSGNLGTCPREGPTGETGDPVLLAAVRGIKL